MHIKSNSWVSCRDEVDICRVCILVCKVKRRKSITVTIWILIVTSDWGGARRSSSLCQWRLEAIRMKIFFISVFKICFSSWSLIRVVEVHHCTIFINCWCSIAITSTLIVLCYWALENVSTSIQQSVQDSAACLFIYCYRG